MSARGKDQSSDGKLTRIEQSPLLADKAYESLREAILAGHLEPGQRLVEATLADELGVSRATVRQAISRLETEGLVELRPRRGSYVTTLSKQDVWEVYTLRAALESMAFRLAAEHVNEDAVASLQAIVDRMGECARLGDRVGLSPLDIQFHEMVVGLSHHERLYVVWTGIISQIQLLSRRVITKIYDDLSLVPPRHQILIDVLRTGSEAECARAIEEHIQFAAEQVLSHFELINDHE